MKTQLIISEQGNIVLSNEKCKHNELCLSDDLLGYYDEDEEGCPIIKDKAIDSGYHFSLAPHYQKLIASDNPKHNLPSINYNRLEGKFDIINTDRKVFDIEIEMEDILVTDMIIDGSEKVITIPKITNNSIKILKTLNTKDNTIIVKDVKDNSFTKEDFINALHKVELKHNKDYSKLWKEIEINL